MGKSKFRTLLDKVWYYSKWAMALFFGLSILSTIFFRFVPVPLTPLILLRSAQQIINGEKVVMYKDWVPMEEISPKLQLAVVCAEDQKYLDHFGFDMDAIKKALDSNAKGKRVRGASTISQQTAKNVYLWPGRNWVRKGLEVYFTLLIETIWSKERILEVYLNVAEMGNGIYGAEAAAQTYFKKPASKLTKAESALIAACLPNPRKYNAAKPSKYISSRQSWIMRQMRYWGSGLDFDKEE